MKFKLTSTNSWAKGNIKSIYEKYGLKFNLEHEATDTWRKDPTVDGEIEIKTIEDLVALVKEVGTIVFNNEEIEIYDDYRE